MKQYETLSIMGWWRDWHRLTIYHMCSDAGEPWWTRWSLTKCVEKWWDNRVGRTKGSPIRGLRSLGQPWMILDGIFIHYRYYIQFRSILTIKVSFKVSFKSIKIHKKIQIKPLLKPHSSFHPLQTRTKSLSFHNPWRPHATMAPAAQPEATGKSCRPSTRSGRSVSSV